MTVYMLDVERVIEDEIKAGAKQRSVALSYAFAIRNYTDGRAVDWTRIHEAIAKRWPKGVNRVKERAWRIYEGKEQP